MRAREALQLGSALLIFTSLLIVTLRFSPLHEDDGGPELLRATQWRMTEAERVLVRMKTKVQQVDLNEDLKAQLTQTSAANVRSATNFSGCGKCVAYDMRFDSGDWYTCAWVEPQARSGAIIKVPFCLENYDEPEARRFATLVDERVDELEMFVRALQSDPLIQLIDVGCGPGFWSLTAASHPLNRKVLALEANEDSLRRLRMAANIGGLTRNLRVLRNFVGQNNFTFDDLGRVAEGYPIKRAFLMVDIRHSNWHLFDINRMGLFDKVYLKYVLVRFAELPQMCRKKHRGADSNHLAQLFGTLLTRNFAPYAFNREAKELNPAKCAVWRTSEVLWVHVTAKVPRIMDGSITVTRRVRRPTGKH